jgi:hypothetical protein
VLLLALVRGVLGIFHLVGELEEGVFDVVEALWRRLAVAGCAKGRHVCFLSFRVYVSVGGKRPCDLKVM